MGLREFLGVMPTVECRQAAYNVFYLYTNGNSWFQVLPPPFT
jgi:hypothetical protein